jgi:NAD(P)H-flavin reductase
LFLSGALLNELAMEETVSAIVSSDKHERRDLSEDLWLIRVDPGGPFQFKAGQYATLGVDHAD